MKRRSPSTNETCRHRFGHGFGAALRAWALAGISGTALLGLAGLAVADLDELRAAARAPPKDPQAALELGRSLRRAGLYKESHRVLKNAPAGSIGPTLRLEAVRALIAAGQQKPAMRECGALKKTWKVTGEICEAEALLLWRRGSLAVPTAERALELEPQNYDALVAKGRALGLVGQPADAESALREAIAGDGTRFEAWYRLGELLIANGDATHGVDALRKAHALEKREPELLLALAEALSSSSERVALLEAAVQIRPDFAAALGRLGEALLDEGKLAEAETALKRALSLDKKAAGTLVAMGRLQLARNEPQKALDNANAALKVVANHAAAKLLQADALAQKGEIDLAIEAYEAAHGYARSNPAPLVHAARACLDGKRPTTAAAFADRATQEFPKWGPAWEISGDVSVEQGEKAAAKAAYQKALSGEGPVDTRKIKAKLAALK
jgi:tetratricopeptide (TPR) repeat protein